MASTAWLAIVGAGLLVSLSGGCSRDASDDARSVITERSSTTAERPTDEPTTSAHVKSPPVPWEAPVGSYAILTTSEPPTRDAAIAGGVVVPVEEPGIAVGVLQTTTVEFFALDDAGHALVANLPLNLTGCSQISSLDVIETSETVTIDIWRGPFSDLVGGCTQPGGSTLVLVEVPNGLSGRSLHVAGCDGSIPGCEPDGLRLEDIPRVRSIAHGCVPSMFVAGDVLPARNEERLDRCDDARRASEWSGWFE